MVQNKKYFLKAILILFLFSCRFNYEEAMFESEFDDQIPKTILFNYKQVTEKEGENTVKLEAEKAENYDQLNKTVIEGLYFYEIDKSGNKLLEGWADKMIYYTETENAEVSDSIYIYSFTEEAGLSADSLYWDKEARNLSSDSGSTVTLKKDDGSEVTGSGFNADLRRKDIKFNTSVSGSYYFGEDDE
jgi:LPS export ABC transporter protein LptC